MHSYSMRSALQDNVTNTSACRARSKLEEQIVHLPLPSSCERGNQSPMF